MRARARAVGIVYFTDRTDCLVTLFALITITGLNHAIPGLSGLGGDGVF